jgi:hypothetical protein
LDTDLGADAQVIALFADQDGGAGDTSTGVLQFPGSGGTGVIARVFSDLASSNVPDWQIFNRPIPVRIVDSNADPIAELGLDLVTTITDGRVGVLYITGSEI